MRRGSAEMRAEMNRIFWAADSTVQTNDYTTYPQTGIGQVFSLFIKPEYQVNNQPDVMYVYGFHKTLKAATTSLLKGNHRHFKRKPVQVWK